jgi:tripartite-type tricarboxylate transporter receptor subunit TctC
MLSKLRFTLLTAACVLGPQLAVAQDYPSKPIRFIVPISPGAGADLTARILAPEMAKVLGQPLVVENKSGAGHAIAYEYVAKQAPADGYTIVNGSVNILAVMPVTVKDLRFDPLRDLPPVIGLAEGRYFWGSAAKFPWKNFAELVAQAKANPGKFNYGASAPIVRLSNEMILRPAGLEVVHIPYASGASYLQGLAAGDIQMGFMTEDNAASFGDRIRLLAVTGDTRVATHPDVPTFAEIGYPGMPGFGHALNVRAGTPKAAMDKLYAAAMHALQQPEVRAQFAKIRMEVIPQTAEVAARKLADEARLFREAAARIGLQPQ